MKKRMQSLETRNSSARIRIVLVFKRNSTQTVLSRSSIPMKNDNVDRGPWKEGGCNNLLTFDWNNNFQFISLFFHTHTHTHRHVRRIHVESFPTQTIWLLFCPWPIGGTFINI